MLDCSALVRMREDGEIMMGHATWRNFAAMLRHYKYYDFHYSLGEVRVSFSASPGRRGSEVRARLHQLEGRLLRERKRHRDDGDDERDLRREALQGLRSGVGSVVHRSDFPSLPRSARS